MPLAVVADSRTLPDFRPSPNSRTLSAGKFKARTTFPGTSAGVLEPWVAAIPAWLHAWPPQVNSSGRRDFRRTRGRHRAGNRRCRVAGWKTHRVENLFADKFGNPVILRITRTGGAVPGTAVRFFVS